MTQRKMGCGKSMASVKRFTPGLPSRNVTNSKPRQSLPTSVQSVQSVKIHCTPPAPISATSTLKLNRYFMAKRDARGGANEKSLTTPISPIGKPRKRQAPRRRPHAFHRAFDCLVSDPGRPEQNVSGPLNKLLSLPKFSVRPSGLPLWRRHSLALVALSARKSLARKKSADFRAIINVIY
jgi:hypothetical protein